MRAEPRSMEPLLLERCNRSVAKEGTMKRSLAFALLVAGFALAGSAAAAGPSPGVTFGSPGVVSHDGKTRYVALRAGSGTLVEAVTTRGGVVRHPRLVKRPHGLPPGAYAGHAG